MSSISYKQQDPKTREQYKKAKKARVAKATGNRKYVRIRLIPIWLRIILFILLIAVCAVGGAMFGYGVIGDGDAGDVFKQSTWTHIRDLITKK
ncbi:DNA-directed RNA polymerase subunit beta [Bacillus sp. FJAT-27445]|uniref:DNA-directed RNA polymerase subunit beta n=1 Tax=Bacillus sp. FJAT-27445 TaxID=1679166 RepID=UPI000743B0A0|nr:DNA-directed RNA polymerase subunit beta [Bacillus sp. FJAT-27445]